MTGDAPKGWTKAQVWEFWQGCAAGFSMYNVNVTTDSAVYAKAGVKNSGIANLYDESGTSFCGVGAFGSRSGCTIYRKSTSKYNAGTLIHELGHLMGLQHDGSASTEYFGGFKSFQWIPVMGSHVTGISWSNTLWQWSKGEYSGANQKQDDLTVLARNLEFRKDDIVGSRPLRYALADSVTALMNRGQIARNTDADSFSFQVGSAGGRARLKAYRTEFGGGSMLDVDASILDGAGKELARSNLAASRSAALDAALPAGRYTLVIRGGAEGTAGNGFTNYSSLGFYAIEGRVLGAVGEAVSVLDARAAERLLAPAMVAGSRLQLGLPAKAEVRAVSLVSARGEKVFGSKGNVGAIEMAGMPAGTYFLKVSLEDGEVVRRVAKL
jgi:hypothetical protein